MDRTASSPPTSRRSSGGRSSSTTAYELAGVVAALLLATGASAQPSDAEQRAKEIEAVCSKAHCRPARTVRLRLEDGKTFEKEVPRLPVITRDGLITVFQGEEVHIELSVAGGAIKSMRAVPKVARPGSTLTFKLGQQPGRADTQLAVSNGLSQNVKYRLDMMLPTGGRLFATTSCPVPAGATTNETWVHPIFQLVIRDLRFLPVDAPLNCER